MNYFFKAGFLILYMTHCFVSHVGPLQRNIHRIFFYGINVDDCSDPLFFFGPAIARLCNSRTGADPLS